MASLEGNLQILLVGDAPVLAALLARHRYEGELVSIRHASQVVAMDAKPADALKAQPDASILVAARLVAEGEAQALVSAGNTGAAILSAARCWKRLPGIRRAALAAVYPTKLRHGPKEDPFALLLDVGATVQADGEDLLRFALLGDAYARIVSANPSPRIALLSNGTEMSKGSPEVQRAHQLLARCEDINFIGNVEGLDIPLGTADVIVTDGFVGNVVLKMLEGVSDVVQELARYAYRSRVTWRIGLALLSQGVKQLRDLTDWEGYGGAPVLGFDHLLIKAHGRSNPRAVRNAIKVAAKAVRGQLIERTAEALSRLPAATFAGDPPHPPEEEV